VPGRGEPREQGRVTFDRARSNCERTLVLDVVSSLVTADTSLQIRTPPIQASGNQQVLVAEQGQNSVEIRVRIVIPAQ
jgi:hypothetical protein